MYLPKGVTRTQRRADSSSSSKAVVHLREVQLGEEFVAFAEVKNVLELWKWILFMFDLSVEFTHAIDCTDGTILLWNCKQRHASFGFIDSYMGAFMTLSLEFIHDDLFVLFRDMVWGCIILEFNMELAFVVAAKLSIKELIELC